MWAVLEIVELQIESVGQYCDSVNSEINWK